MNRKQIIAMWIGAAALVWCLIYPPAFVSRQPNLGKYGGSLGSVVSSKVVTYREWGWAWRDQEREKGPTERLLSMPTLDKRTLGIEVAIVMIITGALIVSFKDRHSS